MGALDDGERVLAPDAETWRSWLVEIDCIAYVP